MRIAPAPAGGDRSREGRSKRPAVTSLTRSAPPRWPRARRRPSACRRERRVGRAADPGDTGTTRRLPRRRRPPRPCRSCSAASTRRRRPRWRRPRDTSPGARRSRPRRSKYRPPSENESGVTLRTPMTTGPAERSSGGRARGESGRASPRPARRRPGALAEAGGHRLEGLGAAGARDDDRPGDAEPAKRTTSTRKVGGGEGRRPEPVPARRSRAGRRRRRRAARGRRAASRAESIGSSSRAPCDPAHSTLRPSGDPPRCRSVGGSAESPAGRGIVHPV